MEEIDLEKKQIAIIQAVELPAEDAEVEKTTGSTRPLRRAFERVAAVVQYVPRRCRYDPEKEFRFNMAMNLLFAFATGFTVANLYYNHPILDVLARDFKVSYEKVSTIPNVMQAGYACGLFFITPLGDIFRRRALTLTLMLFTMVMWLGCTVTGQFNVFVGLSFLVGLTTVTPQIMLVLVGE
ncbi:hypothetical protein ABW21_db0209035 [Orbilia brochopaga]|nr:hypothetical protein ABW21_db0209035 [Drechslerella brochopaga]